MLAFAGGYDSILDVNAAQNSAIASPFSPALPSDLAAAHALIVAERQARMEAEAAAALARDAASRLSAEALQLKATASSTEAMIAHLKLMIEKLRRELYGQRSERTVRLIDQMELSLEELEAQATEDEIAAEAASPQTASPLSPALRRRPPCASPSLRTCRASGSWWPRRRHARAAAR